MTTKEKLSHAMLFGDIKQFILSNTPNKVVNRFKIVIQGYNCEVLLESLNFDCEFYLSWKHRDEELYLNVHEVGNIFKPISTITLNHKRISFVTIDNGNKVLSDNTTLSYMTITFQYVEI